MASLAAAGLADVGHVVAPGETPSSIASAFATTPRAIVHANHLANPDLIVIGTHLQIPQSGGPAPRLLPETHGTSARALRANAPGSGAPPLAAPAPVTYTVRPGDNVTTIAGGFNIGATALTAANRIEDPDFVRIGKVLTIPVVPPATVESLLVKFSQAYKVDPALVEALAWQESGWQQRVVSELGAVGVMQIMPGTGRFTGRVLLQRSVDTVKLEHNVEAGVAFLAYLLRQAGGDEKLAVAGYYQGLRSVRKKGMTADTKRYVANVLTLRQRFAS